MKGYARSHGRIHAWTGVWSLLGLGGVCARLCARLAAMCLFMRVGSDAVSDAWLGATLNER
jgi:hypothetical protein